MAWKPRKLECTVEVTSMTLGTVCERTETKIHETLAGWWTSKLGQTCNNVTHPILLFPDLPAYVCGMTHDARIYSVSSTNDGLLLGYSHTRWKWHRSGHRATEITGLVERSRVERWCFLMHWCYIIHFRIILKGVEIKLMDQRRSYGN